MRHATSRSFSVAVNSFQRNCQSVSTRSFSAFKDNYDGAAAERALQKIVPKPLDAEATSKLIELLKSPPAGEEAFLVDLLSNRISPGVDESAYVKAAFLAAIAKGEAKSPIVSPELATQLLGTMQGGYNIISLVELLDNPALASKAADGLCNTLLMFEAFYDVEAKAKAGNKEVRLLTLNPHFPSPVLPWLPPSLSYICSIHYLICLHLPFQRLFNRF